ncbi:MAG TPA: c-type cytochrome [Kofleriaceae bacterium]
MKRSLVVLFAIGCNSNAAPPPNAPPPHAVRDSSVAPAPVDAHPTTLPGKEIYTALCVPCHGVDLRGYKADNAPSLNTVTFLESITDPQLTAAIMTGRPGTSMAAYGQPLGGPLDDAAVTRLVEYLRSQGPKAKALDPVKPGDAKAGEAIYTKNCVSCHGDKSARKDALHLANPMFISQAPDAFIRYAIANGRPGTKMIAWTTQLTDDEIDNVVAFVRTFGYKDGDATEARLPPPTGKEPLVLNPKGKDPAFKLKEDRFVSVDDANKALKAGAKMIIIDARPPSDWMRVHVKGAVSIPYHDMARLSEIPKDTWVLTYCACPHHLSGIVFDELRKQGHLKSAVLDEGINDWHKKGYPVVAADGVKPPI